MDSQPDDISCASQPPNMTTPVGRHSHAPQQAGCDRDNRLWPVALGYDLLIGPEESGRPKDGRLQHVDKSRR